MQARLWYGWRDALCIVQAAKQRAGFYLDDVACYKGDANMASWLPYIRSRTLLTTAVVNEDVDLLEVLAARGDVDPNVVDAYDDLPVVLAAKASPAILGCLLRLWPQTDVDKAVLYGYMAIEVASSDSSVQLLLDHGSTGCYPADYKGGCAAAYLRLEQHVRPLFGGTVCIA